MTMETTPNVRILVINPNTSTHMTDALRPVLEDLQMPSVQYTFFTSPTPGIPSINSPEDAAESAEICLPSLIPLLPHHDAFLVACYSRHPLVTQLKRECKKLSRAATAGSEGRGANKHVTGIFESSVLSSLALIDDAEGEGFGIVSTGKVWEKALQSAVGGFLGESGDGDGNPTEKSRFYGCETTGLNASELHDLPADQVRGKMMEATKRVLRRGQQQHASEEIKSKSKVKAICLGCAGMVGLEDAVRQACVEELGHEEAKDVCIVDGVKAGVALLCSLARTGF
ncbi:Protein dcg1 [Exophiala oligosperma]